MRFTKAHGTGNDFIVVGDTDDTWVPTPAFVQAVCDRHFGVGGDGLIRIGAGSEGADAFMDYWNADGTTAEMCGNGVRVVAKWLTDRNLVEGPTIVIGTRGGPKPVVVHLGEDGRVLTVTVDMGAPILDPASIPVSVDDPLHVVLETDGAKMEAIAVSMGNPHAVMFVPKLDEVEFDRLGPAFETDAVFPAKANIEFVEQTGPDALRMRVWERGVGETLACGTGACAVGVAAHLKGLTSRRTTVSLRGGDLLIDWDQDANTVFMTGPALEVFEGILDPALVALLG